MANRLLNYTTEVPTERTIAEIQQVLVQAKATSILTEYEDGEIRAVMFKIRAQGGQELPFRLPAKVDEAYRVMYGKRTPDQVRRYGEGWRRQAQRTAWRILLTWVKAQLSIIELEMAKPEEVFLPYLLVAERRTLFEDAQAKHFLLGSGEVQKEASGA
jgi:hypothetical protein